MSQISGAREPSDVMVWFINPRSIKQTHKKNCLLAANFQLLEDFFTTSHVNKIHQQTIHPRLTLSANNFFLLHNSCLPFFPLPVILLLSRHFFCILFVLLLPLFTLSLSLSLACNCLLLIFAAFGDGFFSSCFCSFIAIDWMMWKRVLRGFEGGLLLRFLVKNCEFFDFLVIFF